MSIWFWVFVIAGALLIFGQRRRLKRRFESLKGGATPESEACHKACVDLLREALASGDERAMRQAMEKTVKSTLRFVPLNGRPYPETELENECKVVWDRVAAMVHGEPPPQP
jgi:hypothetical protein